MHVIATVVVLYAEANTARVLDVGDTCNTRHDVTGHMSTSSRLDNCVYSEYMREKAWHAMTLPVTVGV